MLFRQKSFKQAGYSSIIPVKLQVSVLILPDSTMLIPVSLATVPIRSAHDKVEIERLRTSGSDMGSKWSPVFWHTLIATPFLKRVLRRCENRSCSCNSRQNTLSCTASKHQRLLRLFIFGGTPQLLQRNCTRQPGTPTACFPSPD
jgi:hypothetical protein